MSSAQTPAFQGFIERCARLMVWLMALLLTAYALLALSADWIVDSIYANVNPDEIRELPFSVSAISVVPERQFILGGRGEGLSCSIPTILAPIFRLKPVSMQFRQACIAHDYCYRHGAATYDYTQLDCDRQLQEDAFRLCKFVYKPKAQAICQSEARKVLLGVRVGGAGSFRPESDRRSCLFSGPCEFPDPVRVSTYFEYETHPHTSGDFVVARIAPVPNHLARGVLRLGIYYFVVQPSSVKVTVYGMHADGTVQSLPDLTRQIRGSDRFLTAPPLVVGEKFYWWRRSTLGNTEGSAFTLDPLTATDEEWRDVFHWRSSECGNGECDPETQLLYAATDMGASGALIGLSTHSCPCSGGSPAEVCLVSRAGPLAPVVMQPVRSAYFERLVHQDRYKSAAVAPWLSSELGNVSMLWFARRDEAGDMSGRTDMTLFGVDVLRDTLAHGPVVPRVAVFQGWEEDDEPFVIRGVRDPELLALRRDVSSPRSQMVLSVQLHDAKKMEVSCAGLGGDWLDVAPKFFGDALDTAVFERVVFPRSGDSDTKSVLLEFAKVGISATGCGPAVKAEWRLSGDELDLYVGEKGKDNKAWVGSLLLGQVLIAHIDEDPRLDVIVTQPASGVRTLVRMNLF